jgi:nucleoside-diphosphate-sugar epimerase
MKVLVLGAAGALGKPVVRQLLADGHEVIGTTRHRLEAVEELGAMAVVADAFDEEGLRKVVLDAAPEGVIHALTRIPKTAFVTPGRLKVNDRLRIEGTRNLISACKQAGVDRLVAESVTFAFDGRSEDKMTPLGGLGAFDRSVQAAVSLEDQVRAAGGIVLRYGYFYGPGTSVSEDWPATLKRRMMPVVGKGTGWWSFIHMEDAASATIAALLRGRPGETYNVVDDEPILAGEALDLIAKASGAGRPFRLPAVGPYFARHTFNRTTGASNRKAKTELGWSLKYPSFKEAFASTISG